MLVWHLVPLALAVTAPGAIAANVQKPDIELPSSAAANKAAVVDIFTRSYDAYKWVLLSFAVTETKLTRWCEYPGNLLLVMMIFRL